MVSYNNTIDGVTVTGTPTTGQVITATSASAANWQTVAASASVDWINVKSAPYNAVGNGVADDTSAIQAALTAANTAGGATVYFPAGNYKISSALTVYSKVTMRGDGVGVSKITQSSTSANGLAANSLTNFSLYDMTVAGPGSGTGVGVLFGDTGGNQANFYITFTNVQVISFGSHGVSLLTPVLTTFTNVTSQQNGGDGFRVNTSFTGGTSTAFIACYGLQNAANNWNLTKLVYSSLASCASDNAGTNGYQLTNCSSVVLNGCGCEVATTNGFVLSGCTTITLNGCWNYQNNGVAYWVTAGSGEITLIGPVENGPLGGATASVKTDAGTTSVLIGLVVVTPTSITVNTCNILNDGGLSWTVSGTGFLSSIDVFGIASMNAGTNSSGSAPVLTTTFANGTAAQLSDTTRDYMVYFQVGTVGSAFTLQIGPTNSVTTTLMASATPGTDEMISFRLPAGWFVKWAGTLTTLASQKAVGC